MGGHLCRRICQRPHEAWDALDERERGDQHLALAAAAESVGQGSLADVPTASTRASAVGTAGDSMSSTWRHDEPSGGVQSAPQAHVCIHCGANFGSRNALYRHLKDNCDPEARAGSRSVEKDRVVLAVGYLGSRYHGYQTQSKEREESNPTVEGVVVAAARRAWGDVVLASIGCTRTEKGVHAFENIIVLSIRACRWSGEALRRELEGTDVRILAIGPPPPALFDKVYSVRKRVYRCYIPYTVLIRDRPDCDNPRDTSVWVSSLPQDFKTQDVVHMFKTCGFSVKAEQVALGSAGGTAEVKLSPASVASVCHHIHGMFWKDHNAPLLALPMSEAREKLAVQKKSREVLRALRGPAKGHRSFHNFIADASPGEDQAMRTLMHCSVGLHRDLVGDSGGTWYDKDFATIIITAENFAPQQLRRMMGALAAVVRGTEDIGYIHRCLTEESVPVPVTPAESFTLETISLKSCDGNWREVLGVDEHAAAAVRQEVEARIAAEVGRPWADFAARLDSGITRAHLAQELSAAAALGDVSRLSAAVDAGGSLDATDEYGRTAIFLAAQSGHTVAVSALLTHGADLGKPDNAGTTPCIAAAAAGHRETVETLCTAGADWSVAGSAHISAKRYLTQQVPSVTPRTKATVNMVIPLELAHAGAGTAVVDGAFEEAFLDHLEALWGRLPLAMKEKASPTERAYFADAEGWVTEHLNAAVAQAGLPAAAEVLPQMRFLQYPEPGGSLPPHVDLSRVDAPSGLRTTYSFLLYLADCTEGGETVLLECLPGDAALAPSGGVAAGERATVAAVKPQRGRLLLMPHACPHMAAPTVDAPKVLIRGEILPHRKHVAEMRAKEQTAAWLEF